MSTGTPKIPTRRERLERLVELERPVSRAIAELRENSEPLDESGVFNLYRLAARIYASGWADGEQAEAHRQNAQRYRERQALRESLGGER